MRLSNTLGGVICPMVTPFDDSGQVDIAATRNVVDFLLANGVDGIMVGGTTGEGASLTREERKALLEAVIAHADGRTAVIAHTGCITTAETIDLTIHAHEVGAAAASAIVPFFYTLDDESLFLHYVAVAESSPDLPLLLYMFPGNAKNDISPQLMARLLAATDNIVGFKSSNPDMALFEAYIQTGGPDFRAICGSDGKMYAAMQLGSHGEISGNANVYPEVPKALFNAYMSGDVERAGELQGTLDQVRVMLGDGLHPAYFKAGLKLRGIDAGAVRHPMRELTAAEFQALEEQMHRFDPPNWQM